MNCDTAFDLMTDEDGCQSRALAEHLEACPRCRQMQETLAPALVSLMQDTEYELDTFCEMAIPNVGGENDSLAAAESIQIAQHTAAKLAFHAEMPQVRRNRMLVRCATYTATFAAGALLTLLVLFPQERRENLSPASCARHEADLPNVSRTPDEIRELAQSCALCHQRSQPDSADHSFHAPARFDRSWDWLRQILQDAPPAAPESVDTNTSQLIAAGDEFTLWRELA
jgi:hypothetical protein